jgi:hypothetical protein
MNKKVVETLFTSYTSTNKLLFESLKDVIYKKLYALEDIMKDAILVLLDTGYFENIV